MATRLPRAVSPTPPGQRPRKVTGGARVIETASASPMIRPQRPASPSLVRALGVNAPRIRPVSPLRRSSNIAENIPISLNSGRASNTLSPDGRSVRVRSPPAQPRVLGNVITSRTNSSIEFNSPHSSRPTTASTANRSSRPLSSDQHNYPNPTNPRSPVNRSTSNTDIRTSSRMSNRSQETGRNSPTVITAGVGLMLAGMFSPTSEKQEFSGDETGVDHPAMILNDLSDSDISVSDDSSLASSRLTTHSEGGNILQAKLRNGLGAISGVANKATSLISGKPGTERSTGVSPIPRRHQRNRSSHGSGILLGGGRKVIDVEDQTGSIKDEARAERRILDLEITNQSLLAVNQTLEQKMQEQQERITSLEEKLRRASFDAVTVLQTNLEDDDHDDDGDVSSEQDVDHIDPVFIRICGLVDKMLKDAHHGLEYQPRRVNGMRVLTRQDLGMPFSF